MGYVLGCLKRVFFNAKDAEVYAEVRRGCLNSAFEGQEGKLIKDDIEVDDGR